MNDSSVWNGALGADFNVSYSSSYSSNNTSIASVNLKTITAKNTSVAIVSGSITITQNELDMVGGTGFTGAPKQITAPIV